MKTKGFTLIELLAVIVILAIIALIATPIIIDIIEDSKKEAQIRSAENYLKAVELAIAKENLNGEFNPNSCTIESGITKCGDKTLNVTVDGEIPESEEIMLSNGTIEKTSSTTLTYKSGTLTYENNKLIITKEVTGSNYITLSDCTPAEDQMYTNLSVGDVGYKYQCPVDDSGTLYNFYVLSKEGSNVNLILDRNVYYDSENDTWGLADETNKGLIAWNLSGDNSTGPKDALTYLYNATKSWTKIPNTNLNYTDNENTGDYGYTGIETTSGVTKIKDKSGNYVTGLELTNLKARLPKYSEVSAANGTNSYLYDNLDLSMWIKDQSYKPENGIPGIYGYWILASNPSYTNYAFNVNFRGNMYSNNIFLASGIGVRPVITLNA